MGKVKEINLSELLSALLRKAWLIVACAVLLGAASYAYTANFVTPMYRSSITMYVNNRFSESTQEYVSASDLATSQRLVATYVNILRSNFTLDEVAKTLQADGVNISAGYIRSCMSAYSLNETEVFEVSISHKNPYMAARIANAIADAAPKQISAIIEGSSAKVIDRASIAAAPYTPNRSKNTTFGMIGGALIAAVIIVLQTLMDVRVKGEEDLAALSQAPVLGLIPDLAMEMRGQYGYSGYKYSAYKSNAKDSKGGEAEK